MFDINSIVNQMNVVCVPRRVEDDTPFRGQSIFVFAYDKGQSNTFDGYCWRECVYDNGFYAGFNREIEDTLFWSPALFYSRGDSLASFILGRAGVDTESATYYMKEMARISLQYMYFVAKYPNPRIVDLPPYYKQEDYYYPRKLLETSRLDEFTPVYGVFKNKLAWWHNDGEVEEISHFMPDSRLDIYLINKQFPQP